MVECSPLMQSAIHTYEVRPRKDHRGIDLFSDVLPFARLWCGRPEASATGNPISKSTIIGWITEFEMSKTGRT